MTESSRQADRAVSLGFVAMVILLGANFVAVQFSNRELPPFWGAALRFSLGTLILLFIMLHQRLMFPRGAALWGAVGYGLLNFGLSYALAYWALLTVPSGLAAVVFSTLPLMTLLLSATIGLERLGWLNVTGALVAITGIFLIFYQQVRIDIPIGGLMAMMCSVVMAASSSVLVKRLPKPHPVTLNAVGMAVGTMFLLIVSTIAGERLALPTLTDTWIALAWLVMSAVVAFLLFVWIIGRWTASAATYALVLAPVVTIPLASWLSKEPITLWFMLSSIVVLAGAYMGTISRRHQRRKTQRESVSA